MAEKELKLILTALILLVSFPYAHATANHLSLLAVSESQDGFVGKETDLYLEVKEGTGRVFLETYPLSKFDTQLSTRFAKEIACNFIGEDCSKYDFFYAIKADTAIIGGPSAGAATAVLTIGVLKGIDLDESTAITGTINSGGAIGHVGGLKGKIDAAEKIGLTKVIIPTGERYFREETILTTEGMVMNDSVEKVDLTGYAAKKGITLVEANDLNDAFFEFAGVRLKEDPGDITIDEKYNKIMKQLAVILCNRTKEMEKNLSSVYSTDESVNNDFKDALNLTEKAERAFQQEDYYSTASYCFGANTKLRQVELSVKNLDMKQLQEEIKLMKEEMEQIKKELENKQVKTLTDLQAKIITQERIGEAEDKWAEIQNITLVNENLVYAIAYTYERLFSVYSWSFFFGQEGGTININDEKLQESCTNKIAEAEERYYYITQSYPFVLEEAKKEISKAYNDKSNEEYAMCLFRASQSKAQSDVILNALGVEADQITMLINNKLKIAKRKIIEEQQKGRFPILGYSYYEYSNSLKESDPYSALLYAEYALELSNLDMYFEGTGTEKSTIKISISDNQMAIMFIIVSLAVLCFAIIKRRK